jgi:hypothetical protein
MNIDNRRYQYIGELTIKKSSALKDCALPKDDILPWLFLIIDEKEGKRFTFLYKIEQPTEAVFEEPFNIQMAFIMEKIKKTVQLNQTYNVWRGEEFIGSVKIIRDIEENRQYT